MWNGDKWTRYTCSCVDGQTETDSACALCILSSAAVYHARAHACVFLFVSFSFFIPFWHKRHWGKSRRVKTKAYINILYAVRHAHNGSVSFSLPSKRIHMPHGTCDRQKRKTPKRQQSFEQKEMTSGACVSVYAIVADVSVCVWDRVSYAACVRVCVSWWERTLWENDAGWHAMRIRCSRFGFVVDILARKWTKKWNRNLRIGFDRPMSVWSQSISIVLVLLLLTPWRTSSVFNVCRVNDHKEYTCTADNGEMPLSA